MKIYFVSLVSTAHFQGQVYQLTLSDDYVPLWKKAGVYELLYEKEKPRCHEAVPELVQALTEMCIHYLDYRHAVEVPKDLESDLEDLIKEQLFNQARAMLAMLIQAAKSYPNAVIFRETE